jgi:molybdopterin molybdotransferase
MRSVEQHLDAVLETISALEPFEIGLMESRGCVIAEDVVAPWPLPAFDAAAVDGFAVRVADVAGASAELPIKLEVTDIVKVGDRPSGSVISGGAVRVSAGAALPEDTEAVIPLEFTDGGISHVNVEKAAVISQYIRRKGEDIEDAEMVFPTGQVMDPRSIGLIAAVGRSSVIARPKPRVVIISVGAELLDPGSQVTPGKVIDSNGIMLAANAAEAGATVYRVGPLSEDITKIRSVIEDQLVRADLIITVGGTGAASYEAIRQVCAGLGEIEYSRVAMQPGTAQGFGWIGADRIPMFTLPGNPVAAFISFEMFVKPVIYKMQGRTQVKPQYRRATVETAFSVAAGKTHFVRGIRVDGQSHRVRALDIQGTHLIASLARTDCLIVVPEAVREVRAGDTVDVIDLIDETTW